MFIPEMTCSLSVSNWFGRISLIKVSNGAKIRNRYNQVPHLTQDTNGKVTNSQKTPQTRAKINLDYCLLLECANDRLEVSISVCF